MVPTERDSADKMSPEVIEQTYELYRAKLRAFFKHQSRRRGIVDDLMQAMYVRLLSYRPPALLGNPLAYLYKVAWRVVNEANQSTRDEQQHFLSSETPELAVLADQFSHLWVEEEGGEALAEEEFERVLTQLPQVCQAVLLLQCRDGCSYQQIAQKLGISVRMVKTYASRALNHFRRHYNAGDRD